MQLKGIIRLISQISRVSQVSQKYVFADAFYYYYPNCYILNLFNKGIVVKPRVCSKVSPANSGGRLPDVVTTND